MTGRQIAANATAKALIIRGGRGVRPLTESAIYESEQLPHFVRQGIWIGTGLLVLLLVWMSLVRIDEISSSPGQVVPSASVKQVQHLEGGMVSEILVREGDRVAAGQVLARLDKTPALSELEQTKARYVELQLKAERLKAVLEKRKPNFDAISKEFPDLLADQQQLWNGTVAARKSAIEVLDSQVDQKRKELQQYKNLLSTALKQQKLTADQEKIRKDGVDAGVVSLQTYLETKRAVVAADGEVQRLEDQVTLLTDGLAEVSKRRQNLAETQTQDAQAEQGAVAGEFEQVKNNIVKLQDRLERTEIRAPVDGIIQDLKVHTIGEILPAGGILTHIVPADDKLQVEARIAAGDIGHIQVGQPVKIKVGAYDYVRYGPLSGKLARISATTFADEQSKPYYRGLVELDRAWMGPGEGENPLLPGMTAEADIVTGNRTLIQYLLKPIYVSLKDAFHER